MSYTFRYICFMKLLARVVFWISGWKVVGDVSEVQKVPKMIMIAAPHTSNWDLLYARSAFYLMDIPVKYTIKKELFFFPLNLILKGFGGIPIDRTKKGNMVDKMAAIFEENSQLCIMVTPEGTRSYSPEWKKGFYYIALKANVPISLGFLDYKNKKAGVGPLIYPNGNYEEDLQRIKDFYRPIQGKYPEKGIR